MRFRDIRLVEQKFRRIWVCLEEKHNKTGTSQVGAISKAQKAQNIFLEKKLEIFEKFFLSEIVAQCRKM